MNQNKIDYKIDSRRGQDHVTVRADSGEARNVHSARNSRAHPVAIYVLTVDGDCKEGTSSDVSDDKSIVKDGISEASVTDAPAFSWECSALANGDSKLAMEATDVMEKPSELVGVAFENDASPVLVETYFDVCQLSLCKYKSSDRDDTDLMALWKLVAGT